MFSNELKLITGKTLEPLGRAFGRLGISANHITVASFFLTFYVAWLIYNQEIYPAFFFGLILALFDGLDGLIARSTGTSSVRGGYLDSFVDRYADCVVLGALILCDWLEPIRFLEFIPTEIWAIAALIGAFQTSYSRASSERSGVSMDNVGMIERPERAFILGIGMLIGEITGSAEMVMTWVVAVLAILGNFTAFQRLHYFWSKAKD
jgi:phosphatidylglycerophosphate synthase